MMSNQVQYEGARFYKCALQVNPFNYARYRGETVPDEQTYNQQILEGCRENDVRVVGLADHGSIENSKILRTYLTDNDIIVFPGFEIASSEKIHMVCLYQEDISDVLLNQFLGQLIGDNISKLQSQQTHPSSFSCEEIAKKILDDQGGFWYAAHMTGKNGLLRLSGAGDNFVHLWKNDKFVIAGQIPGRLEDLNVDSGDLRKYRGIIENENPDYKREKLIATINAKDVANPTTISHPSASCRIKMTEPGFKAFRSAFYDPESRVRLNHQIPDTPYSCIKSVQWEGAGFFASNSIAFSKHLNAFIGGRGTGKSTLIESIRYVLGLPYHSENDKVLESISKNNLSGSEITLKVTSKVQQGQNYTISRQFGEHAVVKNEQEEVSHLSPGDILPDIELLGQNEILEIERNENAKLMLIRRFLPDSHQFDERIQEIKQRLKTNRAKLIKATEEYDRLSSAVQSEAKLKEQVKKFQELGVQEKLKNASLLEKETQAQKRSEEQFRLVREWFGGYGDVFDLAFLQDENISGLPNKTLLVSIRRVLEELQTHLDQLTRQIGDYEKKAYSAYKILKGNWLESSENIQNDLNQAISKLPNHAGTPGRQLGGEYTRIVQQLTNIEQKKREHRRQSNLITTINNERNQLLAEYLDAFSTRFRNMSRAVEKLNTNGLKGKVKINILRCENKQTLKKFMQDIEGIGQSKTRWLDEENIQLDLVQWSRWIEAKDADAFMGKYKSFGLTKGTVDGLLSLTIEKRMVLEEIELEDVVRIELNVSHEGEDERYVSLENLSTGQKCTAILNLLLLDRDDPLIVDQPEDNLDNAFIADRIVKDIRKFKTNRQFLFATHNANIPILGDAELIVVLSSGAGKGKIEHKGSIDKEEVRHQAAEILEGGKTAFEMRKNKYGF